MLRQYLKPKLVFIAVITATTVASLFAGISYLNSYTYVNIKLDNVSNLSVYSLVRNKDGPPDISDYNDKEPEMVILKNGKYKLKKKYYFYEAKPINNDYQSQSGAINPSDDQNLTINLSLTKEKLAQTYTSQKTNILNALTSKYPAQMENYNVAYSKLYIDGKWFAGYLIPKDGSDKLQVVLHKNESGVWEVVTTPNITISQE